MAEFDVTLEILSPIHLGSGQADVNLDAEIVHDALGFPYFPAKRFKGLLYESAVEILEMFELSGLGAQDSRLEEIFHRHRHLKSDPQLIVPNFYIYPADEYEKFCAEWKWLQWKYPEVFTAADVLKAFTSLRYQTKLEDGIAADKTLRNLRVLDAGTKFYGRITLLNGNKKVVELLALAMKNLSVAGTKRNRGFGRIKCTAKFDGTTSDKIVQKFFAKGA